MTKAKDKKPSPKRDVPLAGAPSVETRRSEKTSTKAIVLNSLMALAMTLLTTRLNRTSVESEINSPE